MTKLHVLIGLIYLHLLPVLSQRWVRKYTLDNPVEAVYVHDDILYVAARDIWSWNVTDGSPLQSYTWDRRPPEHHADPSASIMRIDKHLFALYMFERVTQWDTTQSSMVPTHFYNRQSQNYIGMFAHDHRLFLYSEYEIEELDPETGSLLRAHQKCNRDFIIDLYFHNVSGVPRAFAVHSDDTTFRPRYIAMWNQDMDRILVNYTYAVEDSFDLLGRPYVLDDTLFGWLASGMVTRLVKWDVHTGEIQSTRRLQDFWFPRLYDEYVYEYGHGPTWTMIYKIDPRNGSVVNEYHLNIFSAKIGFVKDDMLYLVTPDDEVI